MKKTIIAVMVLLCTGFAFSQDYTQFVDPFIGTGGHGHTFPGATTPFALVQLSPDAGTTGWDWCSGYHYSDSTLMGFSHTHLSGTGVGDLGDVLVVPYVGELKLTPGSKENPDAGYRSRFDHAREDASPGYYTVDLLDYDIKAELTATKRVGVHRYTFPESDQARILFDLGHSIYNRTVLESEIHIVDDQTIEGYRAISGWVPIRFVYFKARFSKPFKQSTLFWPSGENQFTTRDDMMRRKAAGAHGVVLTFETNEAEDIQVQVGLSAVSPEAAAKALEVETPTFDFESVWQQAKASWNDVLSRIQVEGTEAQKRIFYTGLYRNFISPHTLSDQNGNYIGPDFRPGQVDGGDFYSTFSLWDTYRATHPLYTLVAPEKVPGMIESLLAGYQATEHLPLWALWGAETNCMIGNHAVPVIVGAYLKGIPGIDTEAAFAAIHGSLTKDHFKSPWNLIEEYGYIPVDDGRRDTVSRLLEMCYNDWCAAQLAEELGKDDAAVHLTDRALNYRNVFDKSTGFMRPRMANGTWKTPFNSFSMDWSGYTEATAWQYTWYVPHNVPDLINLMGSETRFVEKLDSLFEVSSDVEETVSDITGLIGQYAHGNEPSHHIAYLYNWTSEPWKTQARIREILDTQYSDAPDGYSGNEDCGQMSAWYIFSSLGFYPVNPCGGIYVFGSPYIDAATLNIGETPMQIKVHDQGQDRPYIKKITLNGQDYNKRYITH